MLTSELIPAGLFLLGILISLGADARLRRLDATPWWNGCLTAAGAGFIFVACATAIR